MKVHMLNTSCIDVPFFLFDYISFIPDFFYEFFCRERFLWDTLYYEYGKNWNIFFYFWEKCWRSMLIVRV